MGCRKQGRCKRHPYSFIRAVNHNPWMRFPKFERSWQKAGCIKAFWRKLSLEHSPVGQTHPEKIPVRLAMRTHMFSGLSTGVRKI